MGSLNILASHSSTANSPLDWNPASNSDDTSADSSNPPAAGGLFQLTPGWFEAVSASAPGQFAGALSATSGFKSVLVSNGGMTFNLEFTLADNPTANFEDDVIAAAKLLSSAISNRVTVNLVIGYGEVEGTALTGGSAAAGPLYSYYESYSSVVSALKSHAAPGDTNLSSLPAGSSIDGYGGVQVWGAELKTLGFIGASTVDDGAAGFATDISDSLMVGVALHELTHALGRVPDGAMPDIMDLFRFSGAGTRVYDDAVPGPASYFSIDGGVTKLADYGQDSDPSDFANPLYGSPLSNLTPNDAFNQYYDSNTHQYLTPVDLTQLDVLGLSTFKPSVYDFNGDHKSDILFRDVSGALRMWEPSSSTTPRWIGFGVTWADVGVGDINGDGVADVVLRDPSGLVDVLQSNGSGGFTTRALGNLGASWNVVGVADFNGDGYGDILLQNATDDSLRIYQSNGSGGFTLKTVANSTAGFSALGVGDFNGDGEADILLRNAIGQVHLLKSNGAGGFTVSGLGIPGYQFVGIGDFNGDGHADIAWQNAATGGVVLWKSNGAGFTSQGLGNFGGGWRAEAVGDYNGDGYSDLLIRSSAGLIHLVEFHSSGALTTVGLGNPGSTLTVQYPA